ncbi:zinc finger BED domain-containing protein 5-like [Alosa pseudoharengus]|uniref:zinc finger BED domain-containing protein 5-like n=1 Tax=Alosa pseudoharengus TaxID=34774 RepID=UPI003F89016B
MMVAVLEELVTDKSMDGVIASVKQMPLSAKSASRRIESLSDDVRGSIMSGLSQANYFSVAIDESTDNSDMSQMCIYVRYFDGKEFREELLALIPLEGNTTGDVMFAKVEELFKQHALPFEKINLIVTDGAPAMVGCHRGTQHRLFRQLVAESEACYEDLLLHNDVRWLSKGKALERLCALLEQVKTFLRMSKMRASDDHLAFLEDEMSISNIAFLTDIFGQLNQLNLQLQGRGKTIVDLIEKMDSFTRKLELFHSDLSSGRLLHFVTLKSQGGGRVTGIMTEFIDKLRANFQSRFRDYCVPREIVGFVRDPLSTRSEEFSSLAKTTMSSLDEATLQLELIDFQSSSLVRDVFSAYSVEDFWIGCSEEYTGIKKLALYVLTMFPSTYTCESSFSSINAIKTHERNRLTNANLENCLRIKVTSLSPDIHTIVTEGRSHFSH